MLPLGRRLADRVVVKKNRDADFKEHGPPVPPGFLAPFLALVFDVPAQRPSIGFRHELTG